MPRKHRDIRSALVSKGFKVEDDRKHIHFVYVDKNGRTTTARTMLSHGSSGDDIGDNLLSRMAHQVLLGRQDFLDLVDCPLSRDQYDDKVSSTQNE